MKSTRKKQYVLFNFQKIELDNIEKGLANMHATDKTEKSRSLARLSEPQGPFRASIAWFGEHR